MYNKIIFLFLIISLLITCKKENKDVDAITFKKEIKQNDIYRLKKELNNNLNSINVDINNIFNDRYNIKHIDNSLMILDSLLLLSTSNQNYFYSVLKAKIFLLKKEKEHSFNELKTIEKINPLIYYYYRGIIFELIDNKEDAIENYKTATKFCINEKDILCAEIDFLANNNLINFFSKIEKLDLAIHTSLQIEFKKNPNTFRKTLIINDFFNSHMMPSD